jgi:AAHS family 4-hydroxybenzoate transporter-like MFS transporter
MFCGFSIGAAVVGWVAAAIMPRFGWQSVFIVGGILPVVIAAAVVGFLPESIRFLLRRNPRDPRAAAYLARIAPDMPPGELTLAEDGVHGGFLVKQLFVAGRHWLTLLLWVMFFANLLDLYFINAWLPTIEIDVGIQPSQAILITSLFQVGGTIGALCRPAAGSPHVVPVAGAYQRRGLCVPDRRVRDVGAWLVVTGFAAGFGVIGAQNGANALAADVYPDGATARPASAGRSVSAGSDRSSGRLSAACSSARRRSCS